MEDNNELYNFIFPIDNKEKTARKILEEIANAIGMGQAKNKDGDSFWYVLIDKKKNDKDLIFIKENDV